MMPQPHMDTTYNRKDSMKTASLKDPLCRFIAGEEAQTSASEKAFRARIPGFIVLGLCGVLMLLLAGCSSESNRPEEPAKPENKGPELMTARSGFQKVYIAARGWNQDARPYRLASVATSDGNGHDGKWAVWVGSFGSPSAQRVITFTWSGSTAQGGPSQGINRGTEDSYSPTNANTHVWDMAFLKIDSDQAFTEAQKHGGDKVLEKSPDTPVTYVCDWNHNTNELVWHVIYGANREGAKLTVAVNASTGAFIRVEK
jgi:hypothetical protein